MGESAMAPSSPAASTTSPVRRARRHSLPRARPPNARRSSGHGHYCLTFRSSGRAAAPAPLARALPSGDLLPAEHDRRDGDAGRRGARAGVADLRDGG